MLVRKGIAAFVAVIAAAVIAVPFASASTQTTPTTPALLPLPLPLAGIGCPIWYGIPNPATGCTPYWVLAYVSFRGLFDSLGFPFNNPAQLPY